MDTRSRLPKSRVTGSHRCVYCLNTATTKDHSPPQTLLAQPFPPNLLTLPACSDCNNGFSFDENVVHILLALLTEHPEMSRERQADGAASRALARDNKLRGIFDRSRTPDGNLALTDELRASLNNVVYKTVQGLFYGLYNRFVALSDLKMLRIENSRFVSAESVVEALRPSPVDNFAERPLSEISANSWHVRQPIFFANIISPTGQKLVITFRLKRETPIEWNDLQPGIFRYAFVKEEGAASACIIEMWSALVVAVQTPWPDDRGPKRKGRNNPMSRERRK